MSWLESSCSLRTGFFVGATHKRARKSEMLLLSLHSNRAGTCQSRVTIRMNVFVCVPLPCTHCPLFRNEINQKDLFITIRNYENKIMCASFELLIHEISAHLNGCASPGAFVPISSVFYGSGQTGLPTQKVKTFEKQAAALKRATAVRFSRERRRKKRRRWRQHKQRRLSSQNTSWRGLDANHFVSLCLFCGGNISKADTKHGWRKSHKNHDILQWQARQL